MFALTSRAGVGAAIVTIMELVLPLLGLETEPGTIAGAVDAIATIIGFILLIWGQLARKDLEFGLFRKG